MYKKDSERQAQAQSSPAQGMGYHPLPAKNGLPVADATEGIRGLEYGVLILPQMAN